MSSAIACHAFSPDPVHDDHRCSVCGRLRGHEAHGAYGLASPARGSRETLFARPAGPGLWSVGVVTASGGVPSLAGARYGLTTAEAQRWLDAMRVERAAA